MAAAAGLSSRSKLPRKRRGFSRCAASFVGVRRRRAFLKKRAPAGKAGYLLFRAPWSRSRNTRQPRRTPSKPSPAAPYGYFTIQQGNHRATHHRLGHPGGLLRENQEAVGDTLQTRLKQIREMSESEERARSPLCATYRARVGGSGSRPPPCRCALARGVADRKQHHHGSWPH